MARSLRCGRHQGRHRRSSSLFRHTPTARANSRATETPHLSHLEKYEEITPSLRVSPWPEAFAAVATKVATDAAAHSSATRLPHAQTPVPRRRRICQYLEAWRRHHPSSGEPGTPPTHGADPHGPHFLNPSRCTTVAKRGRWRALSHSVMA